ncbi:MAG: SurA N-terminal domain-containing protein [Gammaproteobacteria bacterium]|nr:MAG: SurA N-terminal domain-containing protein [Gammaproteobacteria bacterium]
MLLSIRDKASGLVAWIIVIFITIPFALWGIQEYLGGSSAEPLAIIDGEEISPHEFERYYQDYRAQQYQRIQAVAGEAINQPMFRKLLSEEVLRKQAMENFVNTRVLLTSALKAGFGIADDQLNDIIKRQSTFQKDGVFDQALYKDWLRNQGMNTDAFENNLRAELIGKQVSQGVLGTEIYTRRELREFVRLRSQKRNAGYLMLPVAAAARTVEISDAEISARYEERKADLMTKEQISVEYLELTAEDAIKDIEVNEDLLREHYESNNADYLVEDTRDEQKKAEELLKRVRAGESFADLAREFSDDSGSSDNGGDLGYFGRNSMLKPFEDAVYSMKKGDIKGPVKSHFGYHIIKLTGIKGDERRASQILIATSTDKEANMRTLSFEEVRKRVEKDYRSRKAEDLFAERVETLTNLSYEVPDTLEDAANALSLSIKTSPLFGRSGGAGISAKADIVQAAYNERVLTDLLNSDPVELSPTRIVVLRIKEHVLPRPQLLEEVKDRLANELRIEKARQRVLEQGKALLAKVREGKGIKQLATLAGVTWHGEATMERNQKGIAAGLAREVFRAARPASSSTTDKPAYTGATLGNGDYVLIAIYSVTDRVSAEDEKKAKIELQRAGGQQMLDDYLKNIRQITEVIINQDKLLPSG